MYWQNLLNETMERISILSKETPDTFKGFSIMGQAAKTDGHLSEKTKEFIALGIAIQLSVKVVLVFILNHSFDWVPLVQRLSKRLQWFHTWALVRK